MDSARFHHGQLVRLFGLTVQPQYNDSVGIVTVLGGERVKVKLIPSNRSLMVRPRNLAPHADGSITVCCGCSVPMPSLRPA